MAKPVVALVGRPNVGKSLLFNKLAGRRLSIVEDTPGITRDRLYVDCEWNGRAFMLIDTGGIEPKTDDPILRHMRLQAELAIESADVVILLVDIAVGLTAADADIAATLRKSQKPVLLAVNKCDGVGAPNPKLYEFYNLGLGDPWPVSALHGHGTGDLLDACVEHFPEEAVEDTDDTSIAVAVIGKPNAGKSSLINQIVGENRVIVSDVPGTTRDAVDVLVDNEDGRFLLIDTAGIRKKSKVREDIEWYSVLRARMAVARAQVCLILIDALEGVTEQDTKVAGLAHEAGKASVLVINKWDAVDKDHRTMDVMRREIKGALAYMDYAPVQFISALTGDRVNRLFAHIREVHANSQKRVTTGALNSVLADATMRVQPPTDKGRRLKVFYATQVGVAPPHFVFFCNDPELFHFSYRRYLENQIRATFDFSGTPIVISVRRRGEDQI